MLTGRNFLIKKTTDMAVLSKLENNYTKKRKKKKKNACKWRIIHIIEKQLIAESNFEVFFFSYTIRVPIKAGL